MSAWDDLDRVTLWISNDDAERLLSGTLDVEKNHDLADLNAVLNALRSPAEAVELAGLDSVVRAFGGANVASQPVSASPKPRPLVKKLLSGKSLAAIGVVTMVSAGAAAAATGVVPTPFDSKPPVMTTAVVAEESIDQAVAADTAHDTTPPSDATATAAATPGAADAANTPADAPRTTDGGVHATAPAGPAADDTVAPGKGPDVDGPAKFGLCTAYEARTKHDDTITSGQLSVAHQALSDAAATAGLSIADFCADAVPGGSVDGQDRSENKPPKAEPDKPENTPPEPEPGKSKDKAPDPEPDKPKDKPPKPEPDKPKDNPPKPEPDKPKDNSGRNDP